MFSDANCIKIGCDVLCDGFLFHGDLYARNGVMILSGVPFKSYYRNKVTEETKYHFEAKNIYRVPRCGEYQTFLVQGVKKITPEFLRFAKNYIGKENQAIFLDSN